MGLAKTKPKATSAATFMEVSRLRVSGADLSPYLRTVSGCHRSRPPDTNAIRPSPPTACASEGVAMKIAELFSVAGYGVVVTGGASGEVD